MGQELSKMNMSNDCLTGVVMRQTRRLLSVLPVVIPVFFFLLTPPATAGSITLTVQTTTKVTGRNVDAQFRITNNGTERAVDVALAARLMGQDRNIRVANAIAPGKTETTSVDFQLPADVEGTFPILVKVSYLSLENLPYSSAVLAVARTSKAPISNLSVDLKHRIENGKHLVQVALRDPSSRLKAVQLICHVPDDLSVLTSQKTVEFQGNKADAVFHIENMKGMPGSKYGVFVMAKYKHDNIDYLAYSSIAIPIEAGQHQLDSDNIFSLSWRWFLLVIPVLALGGMLAAFSRTRQMMARILKKKPQTGYTSSVISSSCW